MFNTSTRTLRLVLLSLVIILTVSCFGWALQRGPKLTKAAPVFNIITVNTTADDNTVNSNCTLREAILAANTNAAVDACAAGAAGTDTIQFNIGTGTPTINVTSALPNLTEPVVIDGATGGATRIELNGLGAGAGVDGLTLQAGNSTIKSLVINRFSQNGIVTKPTGGNTIQNCFIGTDAMGQTDLGNGLNGISNDGGVNNLIGGTTPGTGNLISGNNQDGILFFGGGNGNQVQGNFIGTSINGPTALGNSGQGVNIQSTGVTIGGTAAGARNVISGNGQNGVKISGGGNSQVLGNYIGTNGTGNGSVGNTANGVELSGNNMTIGGTTASARNVISGNNGDGIELGTGADFNFIQGNYIGTSASGTSTVTNNGNGVFVNGGASNTIGGTAAGAGNLLSGNIGGSAGVRLSNANGNQVLGNLIGVNAAGSAALANTYGVRLTAANNNTIGGTMAAARNLISGNAGMGVWIESSSSGNQVQGNFIGTNLAGTAALSNGDEGVRLQSGASGNTIGGTVAGAGNTIAFNATGRGVNILDNGTINNSVLSNLIFSNGGLGIDLNNNGLTANDTGDPDTGPNNLQNFPVLNSVTSTGTVNGSLDSTVVNSAYPVRIEFFANTACDGLGNGEGEVFLGFVNQAAPGNFTFMFAPIVGKPFITATATDSLGNTSEFSACRAVNTAPTISAVTNTRTAGSSATNSQIATVADPDQVLNTLTVQVNSGASATVNGVTVSNLSVTGGGVVNADVVASCAATNATFTLQVIDNANEMNTATLTVNVTANAAPTLTYGNVSVSAGGSTTNNPTTATDNGSITGYVVQSVGTYTGTISVNASGLVSISNATPVGVHTITIRATDNCGATTDATFTLTVDNNPPMITAGAALTRQRGTAGSVSNIATVSDTETAAGSLVVTATTVPAGITVTGITNTAGTITAIVAADCTAALGNNTVVLTVTDGNSGTATANLTINVAANTAPTLAYGNVSVSAGASTTNNPTTATDNGSITGYVVQSVGTYTGTISVNASGLVSISNATPVGVHTITIRATDNCGATTDVTFTLTVDNNPPMITAGATLTRQRGTAGGVSTIATVSDTETAAGSLTVTATTVPAGITVTGITNTAGAITATFAADCTATLGNNTVVLTVTDGNSGMATANLTVNVTANTAPTLSYGAASVSAGGSTTNSPTTATDNGSITGYVVQSVGTYTGTISVNASGLVSISNATPIGAHTITIRATDNCGATTDATFTLTVDNNPPMITAGAALTRQRGTVGSVSPIATVSDLETAAGSLTVTATTVPAGLTVTGITNTAGAITATVVADCTATLGNNTVVLTVTDGNSGTATANLTISVTANTAPTLTYAATSVSAGGATSNSPTTATDNGSITGYAVQSAGTYTGTISVNASGVVSFSNAAPVGSHMITIQATDNCGTSTTAQFELTVVTCPQITITPASLLNGVPGTAYNQALTQMGGALPVTWSLSAGALPPGLTLSGSGVLAGTPSTIGTSDFTVQVSDSNGCIGTRAYKLTISCAVITPSAEFSLVEGSTNTVTVNSPDSCNWMAESNTPWITIGGNRARSGSGTVNYTVTPNPDATPRTGMLTVAGYRFFVQQGASGLLVSEDFENGIPANWAVLDGGSGGGTASTWTTANPCGRVILPPFNGRVALADAACAGSGTVQDEQLILPVFNATGLGRVVLQFFNRFKLDFGPTHTGDVDVSLDGGAIWTNAFRQVTVDGDQTPTLKTIDITSLVAPNPAKVLVRFHYYGQVPEGNRPTGGAIIEWPIDACRISYFALSATSQSFAVNGGPGSVNVTAAAGAAWTVQSNDAWITALTTAGTGNGTANFTVAPNQTTSPRTGTLTIAGNTLTVSQAGTCNPITVNPATLTNGRAGMVYSQTLSQTGGTGAITWTVSTGSLPAGLTLSSGGLMTGTPTVFGAFNFTARATDPNLCTGERAYTLTIDPPCVPGDITVNPATLLNGFAGAAYTQTLTATGGTAPYSFGLPTGSLPNGLTLASGGALTGTPTAAGTFNFTVTATDANGCTGTRVYTVIVSGNGLQFYPLTSPVRALETRGKFMGCVNPGAPINAGASFTLAVRTGCTGIPANALAVTGNVTVVPGAAGGYLTLFPSSATQPIIANSNFKPFEVTNNVFTTGLGAGDGAFRIFASAATEVIVDITGYYASPAANGLYFHALPEPVRLVETRTLPGLTGCIKPGTPLTGGQDFAVQGRSPVAAPCNVIPTAAQVLVGNATSVIPAGAGFLTIFPSDAARPLIASSNYVGADIINGPFAVKLGADGQFKVYTQATTELVIDILGYYSTEATDANGAGLLFNPLDKPVRLLETRADFPGFPPLTGCYRPNAKIPGGTGGIRTQPSWGICEGLTIPTTARALIGNATVVNVDGAGFMTFYPGNVASAPTVATSNYPVPVIFGYNRHFIVGVGPSDGAFKILTQWTTDLIVDVAGYFAP